MSKPKLLVLLVLVLLVATNAFSILRLGAARTELARAGELLRAEEAGQAYAQFNQLFVAKVLNAGGEVTFEDRLELENAVRGLGDAEVLEAWNGFVNAPDEGEAQVQVRRLLGILAARMSR